MIRDICKDEAFLAQRAEPATPEDRAIARDLLETLEHHKDGCVGMAANMIGINKRIITFDNEGTYTVMFNPEIIKKSGPYDAEEGCLSLAACPSAAPARPSGGRPSRCAGRTRTFSSASRSSTAGPPRLSSMKSTTARGSSYEKVQDYRDACGPI